MALVGVQTIFSKTKKLQNMSMKPYIVHDDIIVIDDDVILHSCS